MLHVSESGMLHVSEACVRMQVLRKKWTWQVPSDHGSTPALATIFSTYADMVSHQSMMFPRLQERARTDAAWVFKKVCRSLRKSLIGVVAKAAFHGCNCLNPSSL